MADPALGWFHETGDSRAEDMNAESLTGRHLIDVYYRALVVRSTLLPGRARSFRRCIAVCSMRPVQSNKFVSTCNSAFATSSKVWSCCTSYHQNAAVSRSRSTDEIRRVGPQDAAYHRQRGRRGLAGHVVERRSTAIPQVLHRSGQTKDKVKFYNTPDFDPQHAARHLRDGPCAKEGRRRTAVQGDRRVAARIAPSGRRMGAGHVGKPHDCVSNHYWGPRTRRSPIAELARTGTAPSALIAGPVPFIETPLSTQRPVLMNVPNAFCKFIDGVKHLGRQNRAWLIIAADEPSSVSKSFTALHHEHADGMDSSISTTGCLSLFHALRGVQPGFRSPRSRATFV